MCGFMFSEKTGIRKYFDESFGRIKYRGPDMTRIIEDESGIWGFHRLSIMDLSEHGMQPFTLEDGSKSICNGELYGFRELKKHLDFNFVSESDCELLLPLWKVFKTDMFKMLDAEFACVLYDGTLKEIIAARDPIGIRPMFYGYTKDNKILFASEMKCLQDLCVDVKAFPPGHYYYKGEFIQYYDATKYSKFINDEVDVITKEINKKLTDGIVKRLDADAPLGFLLSGGLDSSLVCSIAAKWLRENGGRKIRTFAIGMDLDAIDLKYAKIVADYIDSDHTEVIITKEDVLNALKEVIYVLETYDITTIRASIGMYLLCKYIRENTDIKVLLTGEISDELFGYKYTDFAPSPNEFQKESEKRIRELYMYDVLRADRCISSNSIEARVPFGDLKFVDYVMGINPEKKMNIYGKGKYLLRQSFTDNYLPEVILQREKAAFSDAVGHSLVEDIKEYAEALYSDLELEDKYKKYEYHKPPYTKESLLYREIFESFYPGKAELVMDYWLPNKEWEALKDVTDPSARVLANYGDSGK